MKHWKITRLPEAMASRWRRRTVCQLVDRERTLPVALLDVDGRGARLAMTNPPPIGAAVELRHPHAGLIEGRVSEVGAKDIRIVFASNEEAVAFALAAIAADMTLN